MKNIYSSIFGVRARIQLRTVCVRSIPRNVTLLKTSVGIFVYTGECRLTFGYLPLARQFVHSIVIVVAVVVLIIIVLTFGVLRTFFTSKKLRETFEIFICLVCVALLLHEKIKK